MCRMAFASWVEPGAGSDADQPTVRSRATLGQEAMVVAR